jgi:hypothetical protein
MRLWPAILYGLLASLGAVLTRYVSGFWFGLFLIGAICSVVTIWVYMADRAADRIAFIHHSQNETPESLMADKWMQLDADGKSVVRGLGSLGIGLKPGPVPV